MAERHARPARRDFLWLSLSLLIAVGIFGLDLMIPLGVAAGVPYVAVVLLGAWLPWRHSIIGLAAIGTAFTILGFLFSPAAGIAWVVLTNRGLALLVIWVTAILMLQRRAREEELEAARDDLEVRVAERSSELQNLNVDLERQVAERIQAEERSRLLLQSAGEGIYGIDLDGNCTFCNAACIRLLGYDSERDLLGKNMHTLMHHTHADGTGYPVEECRIYQAFRRREGCQVDDEVFWRADGKSFPAEYRSNPMTQADEVIGAVVSFTDITERKAIEAALVEREAHYHGVVDNVADGVVAIDEQGTIESFNRAAELMFGYPAERICGQNVSVLMPEPYRGEHDGYIGNYRRTGIGKILGADPREVMGVHKDGSTFPIELAIGKMDTGDKRIFIGIVRDISQRKESERQLQQAQKMEAVGHLTGGIAHDFNNLLTAILGNLELLQDHIELDPNAQRFLDTAFKAADRGAELTQRLLAFSRKQTLSPEAADCNKLVLGMTELMRRTLGEDIEIETVQAGGLWPAMVDPGQLENALLNLAINARDAMPEGGKLTIETANSHLDQAYADTHEEVSPGQYVRVAVTDTGTGMPPEVVARAFEPFFTTKEVGRGSGLGLSMVYGFVKQSAGHVNIYSEVGHGTTVKLYLPKAVGEGQAARVAELTRRTQPTGDETILVVEDDLDVRAYVVAALGTLGYRVMEAEDGPAALAMLNQVSHINLLLTDVVLPHGMNGRQVAEEVRKRYPRVKTLFTSGYTENAIVHHGTLDKDAELLAKPYTREALARKVRRVLDAPES